MEKLTVSEQARLSAGGWRVLDVTPNRVIRVKYEDGKLVKQEVLRGSSVLEHQRRLRYMKEAQELKTKNDEIKVTHSYMPEMLRHWETIYAKELVHHDITHPTNAKLLARVSDENKYICKVDA